MFFSACFLSATWHTLFSTLLSLLFINLHLFITNIVYLNIKQCSGLACRPITGGLGTICYDFLTVWYTRLYKNCACMKINSHYYRASKSLGDTSIFWRQKGNVEQVQYPGPTTIKLCRTKFSRHGNRAPGVCAPLRYSSLRYWTFDKWRFILLSE
jgi:hypothetical protein